MSNWDAHHVEKAQRKNKPKNTTTNHNGKHICRLKPLATYSDLQTTQDNKRK